MAKQQRASKLKGRTINLTISLDDKAPQANFKADLPRKKVEKQRSAFVDETGLLKLANLVKKTGERNTEHGKTPVQIIGFRDESQRKKIIRMLMDHYQESIWKLLPHLRNLGGHPRAEVRKRVAETVGELMCEDFIRVKEEVLIPWAMHGSSTINANVGFALAIAAKDTAYVKNVKDLLNHWATMQNPDLNWTALASCIPLCPTFPDETLNYLEKSLQRGQIELLALGAFLAQELCELGHTRKVMASLSGWIQKEKQRSLRLGAALIFLESIEFADIYSGGNLIDKAVDIFLIGLEDYSLDNLGEVREAMLSKLEEWIINAFDKKDKLKAAKKMLRTLYFRSSERGKERISYNVRRWSAQSHDVAIAKKFKNLHDDLMKKEN